MISTYRFAIRTLFDPRMYDPRAINFRANWRNLAWAVIHPRLFDALCAAE
jgi:hypothetical protein